VTQPPPYHPPSQGPGPYPQQPYPQQGYPQQPAQQGPYQAPGGYQQQPYAPQGWPQQQPQYGQPQQQQYPGAPQGYQQYQAPQQQAGYGAQAQGGTCRLCGSGPAAQATFRAVVGAAIMHTIWTAPGPYCRDCGMHTFRRQTAKTLAGGWASVGAIILTPFFLLMNLSARGKVAGLPAPQRGMDGRAPLDPGPPLLHRPAAYVYPALVGFLLFAVILANLSG
jgi:hypothetical protein